MAHLDGLSDELARELSILFGGYFNQDWATEYDSPEAVVDAYLRMGALARRLMRSFAAFGS